jgi:hypothetical protein
VFPAPGLARPDIAPQEINYLWGRAVRHEQLNVVDVGPLVEYGNRVQVTSRIPPNRSVQDRDDP